MSQYISRFKTNSWIFLCQALSSTLSCLRECHHHPSESKNHSIIFGTSHFPHPPQPVCHKSLSSWHHQMDSLFSIFIATTCIHLSPQCVLYLAAREIFSTFSFIILKPIPFLRNPLMAFQCYRIETKILTHTSKSEHDWHWLSLQLQHRLLSPSFWYFSHTLLT